RADGVLHRVLDLLDGVGHGLDAAGDGLLQRGDLLGERLAGLLHLPLELLGRLVLRLAAGHLVVHVRFSWRAEKVLSGSGLKLSNRLRATSVRTIPTARNSPPMIPHEAHIWKPALSCSMYTRKNTSDMAPTV